MVIQWFLVKSSRSRFHEKHHQNCWWLKSCTSITKGSLSHFLQGFIHSSWWSPDFWTINSITTPRNRDQNLWACSLRQMRCLSATASCFETSHRKWDVSCWQGRQSGCEWYILYIWCKYSVYPWVQNINLYIYIHTFIRMYIRFISHDMQLQCNHYTCIQIIYLNTCNMKRIEILKVVMLCCEVCGFLAGLGNWKKCNPSQKW